MSTVRRERKLSEFKPVVKLEREGLFTILMPNICKINTTPNTKPEYRTSKYVMDTKVTQITLNLETDPHQNIISILDNLPKNYPLEH